MRFPSRTTLIVCLMAVCILAVGVWLIGCAKPWVAEASDRGGDAPSHKDNVIPTKHSARDARHRLVAPLPEVPCA